MVVTGASTNWKANDEESGNRRFSKIFQEQLRSKDTGSYSYSFTPFLEKIKLHTAREAVQEHGAGFSTSVMLQRYPYKLYTQHGGAVLWCQIQAWVALQYGVLPSTTVLFLPLQSMHTSISIAFKHMPLTSWKHRISTNSSLGWILARWPLLRPPLTPFSLVVFSSASSVLVTILSPLMTSLSLSLSLSHTHTHTLMRRRRG